MGGGGVKCGVREFCKGRQGLGRIGLDRYGPGDAKKHTFSIFWGIGGQFGPIFPLFGGSPPALARPGPCPAGPGPGRPWPWPAWPWPAWPIWPGPLSGQLALARLGPGPFGPFGPIPKVYFKAGPSIFRA